MTWRAFPSHQSEWTHDLEVLSLKALAILFIKNLIRWFNRITKKQCYNRLDLKNVPSLCQSRVAPVALRTAPLDFPVLVTLSH